MNLSEQCHRICLNSHRSTGSHMVMSLISTVSYVSVVFVLRVCSDCSPFSSGFLLRAHRNFVWQVVNLYVMCLDRLTLETNRIKHSKTFNEESWNNETIEKIASLEKKTFKNDGLNVQLAIDGLKRSN